MYSQFVEFTSPIPSRRLFERILTLGWYDGITSGIGHTAQASCAYRFDLLAWGPGQDRRVFTVSTIKGSAFDDAVRLCSEFEQPAWPAWHARWPSNEIEARRRDLEMEGILANADSAEFVIEADSMFETIFASRKLSATSLELIPNHFDGLPHLDNYDYWHEYLGLAS